MAWSWITRGSGKQVVKQPGETFETASFPLGGIYLSAPFEQPPPTTTPLGVNVRCQDPIQNRIRGGSRGGLSEYIPQQAQGENKIQHLAIIADPDALFALPAEGLAVQAANRNLFGGQGGFQAVRAQRNPPGWRLRTPKTPILVTAADITKPYGGRVVFTGATYKVYDSGDNEVASGNAFTADGLGILDEVTGATITSTGTPVTATVAGSTYPIRISKATGRGLSKYTIRYAPGTLTVTPKTLTITGADISKPLGDHVVFVGTGYTVYDAGDAVIATGTAFTTDGLVNADTVTSATLTSDGEDASATEGSYDIDVATAVGTGLTNYTITYVAGEMLVGGQISLRRVGTPTEGLTSLGGDLFAYQTALTGVHAGDLLVLALNYVTDNGITPVAPYTITDSLGSTYTKASESVLASFTPYDAPGSDYSQRAVLWYATAPSSGDVTVSLNLDFADISGGGQFPGVSLMVVAAYIGASATPLDGTHGGTGTSTSPSTGSVAVSGTGGLVMGVFSCYQTADGPDLIFTPGTFTLLAQDPAIAYLQFHGFVTHKLSVSAAVAATGTTNQAVVWAALGVSFKKG